MSLSSKEREEIAAIEDIQQSWGASNAAEMQEMLDTTVYAVKFNFHAGSPGYVGDLYLLQGDAIAEPMVLRRGENGHLIVC